MSDQGAAYDQGEMGYNKDLLWNNQCNTDYESGLRSN